MADAPLLISNSDINGVLKNVYSGHRVHSFPKATVLLAQIKKGKAGGPERMTWGGNGVYFDAVLSRPTGGTYSDAGYFPPSAAAIEKQAYEGVKRGYVTRQIDMLAEAGTNTKEAAFVALGKKIAQEALDAAKLMQQETLHGDGRGIKALIGTASSSTSIIVTSPYGVSGAGQGGLLLDVGMYIAVRDATDSFATTLGYSTVTAAVNSGDNVTLTLSPGIAGMATGDAVVAATASDNAYNAYPNGLLNILNHDGASFATLHNLSGSTYARWNATRLVAGTDAGSDAAQPSESDIWELAARVAGKSGKSASDNPGEFLLMTTPGIGKSLMESFLGQRQFEAPMMDIKGGFKALSIMGLPLVQDSWTPAGKIYLLHVPSLFWIDKQDWTRVQYEDSGAVRFLQGRDAFEFTYKAYWNCGTLQRNAHGLWTGFTDASRYSHVM